MLTSYLFVISRCLFQAASNRLGGDELVLACIGVFACGSMTLFVGRSHPLNLYHVAVPFAVLCAICASRLFDSWSPSVSASARKWFPVLVLALTVACAIGLSDFRRYPHALNYWRARNHRRPETICICESPPDICGVPVGKKTVVERLRRVATKSGGLSQGGKTVAVFDSNDTLLCLMAGIPPWGRYDPMYLFTKREVAQMQDELTAKPPDFIVIHSKPENYHEYKGDDTWSGYHDFAAAHYDKFDTDGTYEFWRRKN